MHPNFKLIIMVKRLFIVFAIALTFVACKNTEDNENVADNDSTVVTNTVIALEDFDAQVADFVDSEIEISGIVDHVCKHGGKKILLVNENGNASVHVESDVRFEDTLTGTNVTVIGIVREFVVDEAYCQQLENDAIAQHSDGDDADVQQSHKMQEAQYYRDSMANAGVDHLSYYSLEFVSFK